MSKQFKEKLPKNNWELKILDKNNHFYRCSQCGGLKGVFYFSKNAGLEDYVNLVCVECGQLDIVPDSFRWIKNKK